MRIFAVKLILRYRLKSEPKPKFFIFDILFLKIPKDTKHNHDRHLCQWKCGRKEARIMSNYRNSDFWMKHLIRIRSGILVKLGYKKVCMDYNLTTHKMNRYFILSILCLVSVMFASKLYLYGFNRLILTHTSFSYLFQPTAEIVNCPFWDDVYSTIYSVWRHV